MIVFIVLSTVSGIELVLSKLILTKNHVFINGGFEPLSGLRNHHLLIEIIFLFYASGALYRCDFIMLSLLFSHK